MISHFLSKVILAISSVIACAITKIVAMIILYIMTTFISLPTNLHYHQQCVRVAMNSHLDQLIATDGFIKILFPHSYNFVFFLNYEYFFGEEGVLGLELRSY